MENLTMTIGLVGCGNLVARMCVAFAGTTQTPRWFVWQTIVLYPLGTAMPAIVAVAWMGEHRLVDQDSSVVM